VVTVHYDMGFAGDGRIARRQKQCSGERWNSIARKSRLSYGTTTGPRWRRKSYLSSMETLRRWLIEAKLWRRRRARVEQAHVWRARRARYGELVQWDTSEHDWLEGRGEKLYLIAMIDDATSELSARFVRHDSLEENLKQLRSYIVQHGRPVSVYTDKASLFQVTPHGIHHRDAPVQQLTQIGRALKELNIEWIAAHSPQAKGRIERAFQTAQDRLVKGLRQVGAKDLESANAYLEQIFLTLWIRY